MLDIDSIPFAVPSVESHQVSDSSQTNNVCPFEGPEKLLEIWFAPNPDDLKRPDLSDEKFGLRSIDRTVWEEMLDIVKCKVLNVVQGVQVDAYLLRLSSKPFSI